MSELEQVDVPTAALGESPRWDALSGVFYWVDLMVGEVRRYSPSSGAYDAMNVGEPVGAVVTRASGGLVFAVQSGFAAASSFGGPVTPLVSVEADRPGNRMNDGACDSFGRFYAGTMAIDEETGAGSVYRLDPDGSVVRLVEGVSISNGIGWSPDETLMYYADTPTGRVDVFSYAPSTGAIAMRRSFVTLPAGAGLPDGLTVDVEGAVWVALWGGSAVHRYLPDGSLDRVVSLPVKNVTACTFGGPDLQDLYITTARDASRPDAPEEGGLFIHRPGVTGTPSHPYGG
jgi:sugar lactone lactonase YvrE